MGCGQSKINLYPRRNKNGGKGNSAKKSGAADKEAEEEEGKAGAVETPSDERDDEEEPTKQILPLSHTPVIEISASQQEFYKMLDEKIEKGKDYDSTSETEIRKERERRRILIDQWRSTSQSTQSSFSQSSPPTPARRRAHRPIPQPPDRQNSPGSPKRCYRQRHEGMSEGMSPPPRRSHSAQSHHQPDNRQVNGDWNTDDTNRSPVKRPQSAGSNWKNNPKGNLYNQKPKKNEANENHKSSSHKDFDQISNSSQDISQITYNPTFQTHSPVHIAKTQQPFKAQIVSYPTSQQVTPPTTPKLIAPPEEYQDPQSHVQDNKFANVTQQTTVTQSSNIYFIHGNTSPNSGVPQDIAHQRQQTAIHLQQYVAMKQAQQQMFTYLQRGPHTVFPNVDFHRDLNRVYSPEEMTQYAHIMRPQSAPTPVGIVRPMPIGPGFTPMDAAHMPHMPMWTPMPPVVSSIGPWAQGQVPPEMQYYPQSQYLQMYRPNSAGSAGTLTRYHKDKTMDDNQTRTVCQSINLVRQKPVGQIVMGAQDLSVSTNASDSPSPASVSTDSGVSPGNSAPGSKNSVFSTPSTGSVKDAPVNVSESKIKKNKTVPLNRPLKNSKSLDSS